MDPKTHDISGLSQTWVSLMNSRENQQTFHRRPVEPMIAAVEIDRALSDIEAQIGESSAVQNKYGTGEDAIGQHGSKVGAVKYPPECGSRRASS